MTAIGRSLIALVALGIVWAGPLGVTAPRASEDQVISAQVVSIAPRWFDPAEAEAIITPYIFYYREQAAELDSRRRETTLHRIQQLMHDKAMFAPIMEPAILYGVGPRVAESALGLITNMAGSAPYEDLRLKAR